MPIHRRMPMPILAIPSNGKNCRIWFALACNNQALVHDDNNDCSHVPFWACGVFTLDFFCFLFDFFSSASIVLKDIELIALYTILFICM